VLLLKIRSLQFDTLQAAYNITGTRTFVRLTWELIYKWCTPDVCDPNSKTEIRTTYVNYIFLSSACFQVSVSPHFAIFFTHCFFWVVH